MLPEVAQAETIWISYRSIFALSLYIVESKECYLLQIHKLHTGAGGWWVFLDLSLARRMAQVSSYVLHASVRKSVNNVR